MSTVTALKDQGDLLNILSSIGMEKYFNEQDSLGWITLEGYEDAMQFMYNAMESGAYDGINGYLYHVNRIFNTDFDSINFYWQHGVIELEDEGVHIPTRKCQEIRVLIEDDYCMLFYFQFGRGSGCALRLFLQDY